MKNKTISELKTIFRAARACGFDAKVHSARERKEIHVKRPGFDWKWFDPLSTNTTHAQEILLITGMKLEVNSYGYYVRLQMPLPILKGAFHIDQWLSIQPRVKVEFFHNLDNKPRMQLVNRMITEAAEWRDQVSRLPQYAARESVEWIVQDGYRPIDEGFSFDMNAFIEARDRLGYDTDVYYSYDQLGIGKTTMYVRDQDREEYGLICSEANAES